MRRALCCMITVLVIQALLGCASVGNKFNYENRSGLNIGVTNQTEAEQLMGKPTKSATISNKDGDFEILQYIYAYGNLGGVAARAMILEFRNGILNAHIYSSGFPDDSTAFEVDSARKIERGKSTKADVLSIMGEPSGKARCPSSLEDFKDMSSDCAEVWVWLYIPKTKGLDASTIKSRTVKMSFNAEGVVSDIQTTEEH